MSVDIIEDPEKKNDHPVVNTKRPVKTSKTPTKEKWPTKASQ